MLTNLNKVAAKRVVGFDTSTNSIAWAVMHNRTLERYGESDLEGDFIERLGEARRKVDRILREQKPDAVCIESVVFVNNKNVVIKLAMFFGVVAAAAAARGIPVLEVTPKKWQYAIGNNSFTKAQKLALRRELPGKSASWYKSEERRRRKQYTDDYFAEKFGAKFKTDNQSDAVGVAYYAYHKQTHR